jgi:nitrite reductase/ring-hydroxylating ferredoxin subunit/uncharacterized membrane protein
MAEAISHTTNAALDAAVHRLETAEVLDAPAGAVSALAQRVFGRGAARDLASGTPLGHPIHPLLVAVPIGSWASATVLDFTGGNGKAAKRLVGLGVLSAVPAALTGANDWSTTTGAERRVGFVHALLNDLALTLYTASWLARRRGRRGKGALFALIGMGVLSVAGWLGGHLAYGMGVGVDTTAFQSMPEAWTDVAAESDVPTGRAIRVDAAGVPLMLTCLEGRVVALADRCTHRGGALHEGRISDGRVVCPLHDSEFDLRDGSVCAGPAVRPQPMLDVRVLDGRVHVRRGDESRSLRTRS